MRCFLILLTLCLLLVTGCSPLTFTVGVGPEDRSLETQVVQRDRKARASVAIIDVDCVLLNTTRGSLLQRGDNPVGLLYEKLRHAAEDDRIKAVVLRLNTPGGGVTASDLMYREVLHFKQQTGKPVVARMMDVCASGGTYLACAADDIVAHPTTVTGSIGVLVQTVTIKPALERWGVQPEAITSGPNKDIASPLGELTSEHRQLLQDMVDSYYQGFTNVLRASRGDKVDEHFEKLTDGRVITGTQARQWGLVDEVGDLRTAIEFAKARANLKHADVVMFHRPLRYVGSPYATAHGDGVNPQANGQSQPMPASLLNLPQPMDRWFASTGGFYYLWQGPGF